MLFEINGTSFLGNFDKLAKVVLSRDLSHFVVFTLPVPWRIGTGSDGKLSKTVLLFNFTWCHLDHSYDSLHVSQFYDGRRQRLTLFWNFLCGCRSMVG